uniref:Uncharacterized protein n=1 Tax=Candidatus Kentrum sp. UNK TaxID=2126344 RepID=A0A451B2K9_9GAMM|nr:MAG: hypothetical protein BECKUNK1418G_GA0071005_11272 [Candidatus Kentron sp. UNK]VFK72507.1 MAG: hypothetical protein BECKUNK1418H_GA0071006_11192 [Candidatus Kentron sp. UNK]
MLYFFKDFYYYRATRLIERRHSIDAGNPVTNTSLLFTMKQQPRFGAVGWIATRARFSSAGVMKPST